ncbi:uncharacterized protein METZ01_LOCUS320197 [marine metagenome]|uniref:Uncharacterized protein n=1 Tax=marine metagenome TaxID=408172 RepID=A0A382P1V6_9ZZZZ
MVMVMVMVSSACVLRPQTSYHYISFFSHAVLKQPPLPSCFSPELPSMFSPDVFA